jgi:hypothetical protein
VTVIFETDCSSLTYWLLIGWSLSRGVNTLTTPSNSMFYWAAKRKVILNKSIKLFQKYVRLVKLIHFQTLAQYQNTDYHICSAQRYQEILKMNGLYPRCKHFTLSTYTINIHYIHYLLHNTAQFDYLDELIQFAAKTIPKCTSGVTLEIEKCALFWYTECSTTPLWLRVERPLFESPASNTILGTWYR